MMALVTECHPFDDGNGRAARLMANAELSAAGQVRLVIPTVFRNNDLLARCNANLDPDTAETSGLRLVLPSASDPKG